MASDIENTEYSGEEMSLQRFNPANPFSVPPGYFDELDQRIMSSVYFSDLKDNSSLQGFNVPDNYFEASADQIMSRIHIEELAGNSESFTVEEDYFANLTQQITSRIAVEEALEQHEEAFSVPDGYFEQLNRSIMNRTVNHDMVMRKGIVRRLVTSGAFKYASAACVALIVGIGIFLSQDNTSSKSVVHDATYLHKELSKIPADAIESYLQTQMDGNDVQHTMESEDAPVDYSTLDSSLQGGTIQK